MAFLKISQNQSKIEQDYALQSSKLLLLFKGWLIQTAELLTWATVNIGTADNNCPPLMQPTVYNKAWLQLVDRNLRNVNMVPIFSAKCNTISSCCSIFFFFSPFNISSLLSYYRFRLTVQVKEIYKNLNFVSQRKRSRSTDHISQVAQAHYESPEQHYPT